MTLAIVFLGFVVSAKGLEVDLNKVKTILEWPVPSTLHELRGFHGLSHFIDASSEVLALLWLLSLIV